jgi:hypothetical protein
MMAQTTLTGADWLRQWLTREEQQFLRAACFVEGGVPAGRLPALQQFRLVVEHNGRLVPQPDLRQVDWVGLRTRAADQGTVPGWQQAMRGTAELQGQLVAVFEAASGLRRPALQTRRERFLFGQEWVRPLWTVFRAVGGDLARFETVLRNTLSAKPRALLRAPVDVRQDCLQTAAREFPEVIAATDPTC